MLKDEMTIVIHSCGAYSDLWNGQVELIERNWADRSCRTLILTDTNPQNLSYSNVEIIAAGEGKEITDRLSVVLPMIETEYVFVTLDDYYLIDKVDNNRISYLLTEMERQNLDYIRLFPSPRSNDKIGDGLFKIHYEEKKEQLLHKSLCRHLEKVLYRKDS